MIDSMVDKKFTNEIGKNMQFWIKKIIISKKKKRFSKYIYQQKPQGQSALSSFSEQ